MNGTIEDLAAGWHKVIATRNASPDDCACRAVTGPLIAEWQAYQARAKGYDCDRPTYENGDPYPSLPGTPTPFAPPRELLSGGICDEDEIARQWTNLRAAQAAQAAPSLLPSEGGDVVLDVRSRAEFAAKPRAGATNIPIDDLSAHIPELERGARFVVYCASGIRAARAVHMLRAAGRKACNGHEPVCEIGPPAALGDPRLGAAGDTGGIFDQIPGLLGNLTGPAAKAGGAAAGGAAGQSAIDEVVRGVPRVGEAVRAEVPALVAAGGQAAGPAVTPLAQQAGEAGGAAAGKAAVEAAKKAADEQGWSTGTKVGAVVAAVAAGGLLYLATRKGSKK